MLAQLLLASAVILRSAGRSSDQRTLLVTAASWETLHQKLSGPRWLVEPRTDALGTEPWTYSSSYKASRQT